MAKPRATRTTTKRGTATRATTRTAAPAVASAPAPLTDKQARFVEEYLVDLNATQAAIRAGYSERNADKIGPELLGKTRVAAAIAAAQAARSERVQITQDDVLHRFWAIATADPNELIEFRRACCRHCYGEGYRCQRTRGEMDRDRAAWDAMRPKPTRGEQTTATGAFDAQGGAGYDARKAPNPTCPECFGEGVGQAFVKDTRTVSPAARIMYAGVKVTKDGLEIKMHDQHAALVNVAKHLGMFVEKVEHSGEMKGGVLVVPGAITAAEWSVAARTQQAGLVTQARNVAEAALATTQPAPRAATEPAL